MNTDTFWMILCSAGAFQSMFLCVFFFFSRKIKKPNNVIIGSLFLAVSIRLIKSIGWYYFDIEDIKFLNTGFIGHAFIAPLLVLYLEWSEKKTENVSPGKLAMLFLPAFCLLAASPFITLSNFWYSGGYKWLLYSTLIYLVWGAVLLARKDRTDLQFTWTRNLFIGISLFCILYFTNYILGLNQYISGPITYSLAIYFISFSVFRNQEQFEEEKEKYRNIRLTDDQINDYKNRILSAMETDKIYLNGDFNLSVLSEKTNIPKHLLSNFFSSVLNKSFTDYTNEFRIAEAKKKLADAKFANFKIAAIAYDCGFNTLSTFNAAFKKTENTSPSEFRKKLV